MRRNTRLVQPAVAKIRHFLIPGSIPGGDKKHCYRCGAGAARKAHNLEDT